MNVSGELKGSRLAEMLNNESINRIMAVNSEWRIIAWNQTSETDSGIPKDAVIGRKLLDVFPRYAEDKEIMDAIENAFSGNKITVPYHTDRFNRVHYENFFIPLKNTAGKVEAVMNIMQDVSYKLEAASLINQLKNSLRKKEQELSLAQDELAGISTITSTNIKDPLRQVYASLEILIKMEAKAMSDGGKANLRRIQASLNRVNLLLLDVLMLTGITAPAENPEKVDLNLLLKNVCIKMADKIQLYNVSIKSEELPVITGYNDLLEEMFECLVKNAIRFRRHGMPVHLSITAESAFVYSGKLAGIQETPFIKISFTDDGNGFIQENAGKIFRITEHAAGNHIAGVNPAICRKIMTLHDGLIEAQGWPEKGSAIHCYFPAIHN